MANISDWSIQQIVDKAPNVERAWVNDATPPGMFDYVSGDSTSTSDGVNVLVSTSGERWHRVGEMPHITIAALRLIRSRFNMCYITDAGKQGIFLKGSNALSDDGISVITDLAGDKFTRVMSTEYIKDGPAQASYMTQGEDIIRVTSVALKSIIISDLDIAGAYTKKRLTIKDEVANAGTTPIVITGESGQLIDGQASISIAIDYGSISLYSNGTDLFTVNRFG